MANSLEKQKERMKKLQEQIKNEEIKLEGKLGKSLIKELNLNYENLSDKDEFEKIVKTILGSYPKSSKSEKASDFSSDPQASSFNG